MSVIGTLIRQGLQLWSGVQQWRTRPSAGQQQRAVFETLLSTAKKTAFGRAYNFDQILGSNDAVSSFQKSVPVFDYDRMHEKWWHRALDGEADVTWPGCVPAFALSSGTSGASSKHIPVTKGMVAAFQRAGMRQLYSLPDFRTSDTMFEKQVLFLGGSTALTEKHGSLVGDVSGITAAQFPAWFERYVKVPGPKITTMHDWSEKLAAITRRASEWDVGIVCGIPAWVQMLFQQIVEHYDVDTIHDVWPNLSVYVHGGVNFGPYRRTFRELGERPLITIETYIASEGYIAYQPAPERGLEMIFDNGVFYEFVPFTEENFTPDGKIRPNPKAVAVDEVKEGTQYALLLSTCAGAWRYMLGDVIEFTDVDAGEIIIVGRTQHFLNLCGEHLSGVNMADAVARVEEDLGISIPEFTVVGEPGDEHCAHHWYVGIPPSSVARDRVRDRVDAHLQNLNDDYRVERSNGVLSLEVTLVRPALFYAWMDRRDKLGGQNKFPRVLAAEQAADWRAFLRENRPSAHVSNV